MYIVHGMKGENMNSNFIISLDFELIWGMHEGDIVNNSYNGNIKGGRKAIPDLLKLFEKHGIHATWAVVGLMFAENVEEARKYFPKSVACRLLFFVIFILLVKKSAPAL